MARRRRSIIPLALAVVAAGCGYHVGGQASRLPGTLETLAIPAFVNRTSWMRLEQRLTGAVVQEFIQRTGYQVTGTSEGADAVLNGTILAATTVPVLFDPNTGRASAVQVTVTLAVELRGAEGSQVLYANPDYVFHEQYEITGDIESFFEERDPALDRLARDFAAALTSAVLENF